jgi:hypothetical protein
MTSEWVEWHRGYEEGRPLTQRLRVVQDRIREALDDHPSGPIRILSLCAGDGRDLIGVLEGHPRAGAVRGRLVEQTPELVDAGRERAARDGLTGLEFVQGDASTTDACNGAVPADIVLACGIFGNISDEDVRCTIDHLPELCAEAATVIWTRGRFAPDLTPTVRRWFAEAGFSERSFVAIPDSAMSVGSHRLAVPPRPVPPGTRLFTFLPKSERPSQRPGARGTAPASR